MAIEASGDTPHEADSYPTGGRVDYPGPFAIHAVTVDGRRVPFLEATPLNGGRVDLTLDNRYGLVLDLATAERVIPFLADAIAIAMGYTCHPRPDWDGPKPRPAAPRLSPLTLEEG
jgi:hypothetical protein